MAKCQEASGKNKEAIASYNEAYSLDNSIAEAKNAMERLEKQVNP